MTYREVKDRLQRAVARASVAVGERAADERFVAAVRDFPESADEVAAYRESLVRLAPEMRGVLEHALTWIT